jgi:hypothetical protein
MNGYRGNYDKKSLGGIVKMIEKYEKYLELLRKRYIRNGIIELGDLSVEQNTYELVAALSNLEDINRYLAVATDNNSSLQILKKDYTTFYESLRKKVVDEYNTLYDERIDELYTDVLNQVKIGTVEVDYRVVGKDVSPYVLPEVEVEEVKLTPQELQEVKMLATIVKDIDEEEENEVVEDKFEDIQGLEEVVEESKDSGVYEEELIEENEEEMEDLEELDEEEAAMYGLYDDDEEDMDEFDDEDEYEVEIEDVHKEQVEVVKTEPVKKSKRLSLGSLADLENDREAINLELPKGLRRDFSVGLREPVRKSAFVPKRPSEVVSHGRENRFDSRSEQKVERPKEEGKVVNKSLNERVYDKIDNLSGSLVDRLVKKIRDGD